MSQFFNTLTIMVIMSTLFSVAVVTALTINYAILANMLLYSCGISLIFAALYSAYVYMLKNKKK